MAEPHSAIALGAGAASHSLSLQAFGLDSVIELIAGGVLLWRLHLEQRARRSPTEQPPCMLLTLLVSLGLHLLFGWW